MSENAAGVFVTVDIVIPRLSPSGSGWEVVLIQRKRPPYEGLWALPGGHLTIDDASLEAAARREVLEETGLDISLPLFQQVQTYEDFEDPRGKYVCLLYTLSEPLSPEESIVAGDDASHVQWYSVENLQSLPYLAFNHIRLLRAALRQFFTSYYHTAVGLQAIDACQCEVQSTSGEPCPNTAYWRYNRVAVCPRHIQGIDEAEPIRKISSQTCCNCGTPLEEVTYPQLGETFIGAGPPVLLEDGSTGHTCQDCFEREVAADVEEHMQHAMEKND